MRVLHFSAQPLCDERLMLAAELRSIADALLPGKVLNRTTLESVPQARPSDIDIYLSSNKPHVVHFAMHGTDTGLHLCDAYLDSIEYPGSSLARALKDMGVKLVVLNACESEALADEIKGEVEVVISTTKKLSDEHAIVFSEVFYRGLQVGLSIAKAYQSAVDELELISKGSSKFYVMKSREPGLEKQNLTELQPTTKAEPAGNEEHQEEQKAATAEEDASIPTAQHRLRGAAARLEAARFGAEQEAADNRQKLNSTLIVAVVLSLLIAVYPPVVDWLAACPDPNKQETAQESDAAPATEEISEGSSVAQVSSAGAGEAQPANSGSANSEQDTKKCARAGKLATSIKWLVGAFSWIQLNGWLLFTFFAAPPALYLIEFIWLRRPLEDAEKAAFGLALKAPDAVDPDEVVARVEALVRELDESNKSLFDAIRGGQSGE
jgi:hypothetical protein